MNFDKTEYFIILLGLTPYVIWIIINLIKEKKFSNEQFSKEALKKLFPSYGFYKNVVKSVLLLTSLVLALLALGKPYMGSKIVELKAQTIDLIIALDCSPSMWAQDVYPNRFEVAKNEIKRIIRELDARVCLIPFSGSALLTVPFTQDRKAVEMILDDIDYYYFRNTGTDFKMLFDTIINQFQIISDINKENRGVIFEEPKILLILTDGDLGTYPNDIQLQKMKEKQIELWIEIVSTKEGASIPIYDKEGKIQDYINVSGERYISKPDLDYLKTFINKLGGSFYIYDSKSPISRIFLNKVKNNLNQSNYNKTVEIKNDIFQFFTILSIILTSVALIY